MKVKSLEFRPHRSLQFLQLLELLEGAVNKVAPAQPLWAELFKKYFVNSNKRLMLDLVCKSWSFLDYK